MSNRTNSFIFANTVSFGIIYGIPWGLWLVAYILAPLEKIWGPLGYPALFVWHVSDRLMKPFGEFTFYAALFSSFLVVAVYNKLWERKTKREQGISYPSKGFVAAWWTWFAIGSVLLVVIPAAVETAGFDDLADAMKVNLLVGFATAGVIAVIPAYAVFYRNLKKALLN